MLLGMIRYINYEEKTILDIFKALTAFSTIEFDEENHIYYHSNRKERFQSSVTEKIGQYKEEFDTEKWSVKKAQERGITPEEVVEEWKNSSERANHRGSEFHRYAEYRINNKIYNCDISEKLKEQFHKFYSDSAKNLVPIKSELVIGDIDLSIAGTIDQLYWSHKKNGLVIFDWKTNKKFTNYSRFKKNLLGPLKDLEDTHINVYSLQLNIYKYIFEKVTGLEIKDLFIVWFNENNSDYIVYRCKEFQHRVKQLLGV